VAASAQINPDPRRRVVELANAYIANAVGLVEVSREMSLLRFKVGAEWDEDFVYFVAVDSETDTFPVGPSRVHWSPAALAREDAAREQYEVSARERAVGHAQNLAAKYRNDAV
jgi:hypothetical protein